MLFLHHICGSALTDKPSVQSVSAVPSSLRLHMITCAVRMGRVLGGNGRLDTIIIALRIFYS